MQLYQPGTANFKYLNRHIVQNEVFAMNGIKLLILDVLKPLGLNIIEYAEALAKISKDYSINVRVEEIDKKTETIEIIILGDSISYKKIEDAITNLGGTIHSIDEVSVGKQCLNSSDFMKVHER